MGIMMILDPAQRPSAQISCILSQEIELFSQILLLSFQGIDVVLLRIIAQEHTCSHTIKTIDFKRN